VDWCDKEYTTIGGPRCVSKYVESCDDDEYEHALLVATIVLGSLLFAFLLIVILLIVLFFNGRDKRHLH
jgi:hypothetical protein